MIRRDDLLDTKRLELQNVVNSRKRKLSQLYFATVASKGFENINRDKSSSSSTTLQINLNRDEFLDVNDILLSRRFDIKTVAEICISPTSNSLITSESSTSIDGATSSIKNAKEEHVDGSSLSREERNGESQGQTLSQVSSPKKTIETVQLGSGSPRTNTGNDSLDADDETKHVASITTDPTTQLLSEDARNAGLIGMSPATGSKRNFDTVDPDSPNTNQAKRRKDERQPIRIDTSLHNKRFPPQGPIDSATPLTAATPERMTTRVSSGALRHKSVSEILGETPRAIQSEQSSDLKDATSQTPRNAAVIGSPSSALFQSKLNEIKDRDKDRTKMSTVVFPRQTIPSGKSAEAQSDQIRKREKPWEQKDYLVPLFYAQASAQNPKLNQLVVSSKKTLSSNDHRLEYREDQDCRILKRIYHLQNNNRWSLRQLERCKEPERPMAHWDAVLAEAKWMRTDFREERRWMITAAKNVADWCAEYVNATDEERKRLRFKPKKARRRVSAANHTTPMSLPNASNIAPSDPTPELIPSTADDTSESADDDSFVDVNQAMAPAALFSLSSSDILFDVEKTPAADKILEELPLYEFWPDTDTSSNTNIDASWKTPIAPVTKYASGKMVLSNSGPIRRKTRFSHPGEDDTEQGDIISAFPGHKTTLSPEKNDVALFDPENRHIVARLHAAHAFRPPSEFAMPGQGFFEARQPSQWTISEDDQLRRLVREYEYNWSLISACMASQSRFSSGAERRTPWECFERWVSFEGLPGDMAKHQYFRAWNLRREAAKEHLEQIYQAQLSNPATAHLPPRRRSAEPLTVERRKQGKYLSLFTIMSKVIKKREIAAAKSQAAAAATPPKKASTDAIDQRPAKMRTPKEFSQHKHKQECEFREKRLMYQQQMMAQQRAAAMAKVAQATGQAQQGMVPGQGVRPGMPMQPNGTAGHAPMANGTAAARVIPNAIPNMTNSAGFPTGQMNVRTQNGLTPAQMAQATAFMQQQQQAQRVVSQGDASRIMLEAARVSNEQRLAQQRQFQPGGAGGGVANMVFNSGAMFNANGKTSPAGINAVLANGNRPSSSAGNTNGATHGQQLSNGMVPVLNQVTSTLKAQHPNATPEQIMQMATLALNKQLQRQQQQQQQNNMAANGTAAMGGQVNFGNNGGAPLNPQLYAQIMRSQQMQQAGQQNRPSTVSSAGGRSGSPNDQTNRPGSQGSVMMQKQSSSLSSATNQSPRPPPAQMAGSS